MKTSITIFLSLLLTGSDSSQFFGYEITNNTIKTRLFVPNSKISLGEFIGSEKLGILLGSYEGDGLEMSFENGEPNSNAASFTRDSASFDTMGAARSIVAAASA